jgi:hypothetical protein
MLAESKLRPLKAKPQVNSSQAREAPSHWLLWSRQYLEHLRLEHSRPANSQPENQPPA